MRFTFLVIAQDGRLIEKPTAEVWIARAFDAQPYLKTTARLEPVGVQGTSQLDVQSLYVAHLRAPKPGTYWVFAKPAGAAINGLGNIVVRKRSYSKAVGVRAPVSKTPTLADTGGRVAPLSTSVRPDRELYTTSVAQALAAHEPFVVTFATPKFCASRTCGPVVDVVTAVRKQLAGSGVRFIHAEVYKGNDPAKGYNRWLGEWGLRSEPWTFLVGRDGRIKAKFEGSVSVRELAGAVRSQLVGA